MLHIMAIVQRHDTEGRAYYCRKLAAVKTSMGAVRALKRRLSDIVYERMANETKTMATSPGVQRGATLQSSAASPIPTASTSDKSLPGPATKHSRTLGERPTLSPAGSRLSAVRPRQPHPTYTLWITRDCPGDVR